MCQIGVKILGGSTRILEHDPKASSTQKQSSPYALVANTPDRVEGQFTW